MRRTYRQDPETREFYEVTRSRRAPAAVVVIGDIEPFQSPITGEAIGSRRALRAHNAEHDVVQHREFGDNEGVDYIERAQTERIQRLRGQTERDRRERLAAIIPIVTANES